MLSRFTPVVFLAILPPATASLLSAGIAADGKAPAPEAVARWMTLEEAAGLDGFGHEASPSGEPVGGGPGYSRILTSGDFTARSYEELRAALARARPGEVVFVPGDAVIDCSGRPTLVVPESVTLASDRGNAGAPGGLLFSDALDTRFILEIAGSRGRITGLRIRGPFDQTWRVPISSRGLRVSGPGGEVDNCEISAFSHQAISAGGHGARIAHNFIHHNQRNGLGYGVSVGGSLVVVEGNHFDFNRHDIAASGSPGLSYVARFNLVGPQSVSHHFDVHGGRDRGDGTDIAGDLVHIHHNTFLGSGRREIGIRGVPSQGAWIHHNWFVAPSSGYQIFVDGNAHIFANVSGTDKRPFEPTVQSRAPQP